MKKSILKSGSILFLMLSSCAPMYVPNVINTALLKNQGEIQMSVYTGTAGIDPQFAFAITDHIGIMANGSFADRSDTTGDFHKHTFVEFGAGYFENIGGNGVVEVYGGYGFGKLEASFNSDEIWTSYANVTSNRIFLQPSIGLTTSVADIAFSPRLCYVTVSQESVTKSTLFFEPAITGKVGFKYVKFNGQLGFSVPANGEYINYQPIMFSIGMQVFIGRNY